MKKPGSKEFQKYNCKNNEITTAERFITSTPDQKTVLIMLKQTF